MKDINRLTIVGRLTRDMELKYLNSGTAMGKISIACNDSVKGADGQYADKANFFDATLWGKTAEGLNKYLTKGQQVCIDGRIRQETWQDNQSGQNRSKVSIHVESIQLLQKPKNSEGGSQYTQQASPSNPRSPGGNPPAYHAGPEDFEDDIPF